MGRTELPWLFMGRKVRPYVLAVSVAAAALSGGILSGTTVWGSDDWWSAAVAVLAGTSTIALWVGFWWPPRGNSQIMEHGLLLSAIVFAVRGVYIGLTSGNWLTGLLAGAWCLASGGAWLLERTTGDSWIHERGGGGGE